MFCPHMYHFSSQTYMCKSQVLLPARNEVGARLYFHRRLWFCWQGGGGSASVHAGIQSPQQTLPGSRHPPADPPPPEQTPPQDQAPPGSRHHPADPPESRHPPGPGTPGSRHPPGAGACWEIRSTGGRYASYWNAILFCRWTCRWIVCDLVVVPQPEATKNELKLPYYRP